MASGAGGGGGGRGLGGRWVGVFSIGPWTGGCESRRSSCLVCQSFEVKGCTVILTAQLLQRLHIHEGPGLKIANIVTLFTSLSKPCMHGFQKSLWWVMGLGEGDYQHISNPT